MVSKIDTDGMGSTPKVVPLDLFNNPDHLIRTVKGAIEEFSNVPYEDHLDEMEKYTADGYLETIDGDRPTADNYYKLNFDHLDLTSRLTMFIAELFPKSYVSMNGHFLYPPGGYMGWHTNSDYPYKRVYITYSDGESFFKYKDVATGKIVTDYDDPGTVKVRLFHCGDKPENHLWHCIGSRDANRYSFGFRIL